MEDFKNRLLEFIGRQYGLSQRAFEEKCGIAQGTVSSIKTKGPSVEVLTKISNTFPELNLNWLIVGTGPMLNESGTSAHPEHPVNAKYVAHLEEEVSILRKEKEELWTLVQKLMK